MAKPFKYLVVGLVCAFINSEMTNAQLPVEISKEKAKNVAKEFIEESDRGMAKFLRQTEERLSRIFICERKMHEQVDSSFDPLNQPAAESWKEKLDELARLKSTPDSLLGKFPLGPYNARLDSLSMIFSFFCRQDDCDPLFKSAEAALIRVRQITFYSSKLNFWIEGRRSEWLDGIRSGGVLFRNKISENLARYEQSIIDFRRHIDHWKDVVNDSERLEAEVLKYLRKWPVFNEFLSRNCELARLFGGSTVMVSAGSFEPVPGLQTLQSVMQDIQLRYGNGAIQPATLLPKQVQTAIDQFSQDRGNFQQDFLAGETMDEVSFFANSRNSFSPAEPINSNLERGRQGKRIELGWNLQSAIRIGDFPAVRDIGFGLGYKLNSRSVLGVGIAYKFALGKSWKDINWTHEGFGFRSFFDWRMASSGSKIFQGLWLTGGFEMNYWSRIARNAQWHELAWRTAGMAGISKTIPGKKRNGKLQILFNFLETNLPLQDRLCIRWGKTF